MTKEINPDILLINIFINTSIYNKYSSYINNILLVDYKTNNKLLYKIYKILDLVHIETNNPSYEDIYLRLLTEYPALPVDERELVQETLQKASEAIYDPLQLEGYIEASYKRATASQMALKAIEVAEGRADFEELSELANREDLLTRGTQEDIFYGADLSELYHSTKGQAGLRWPLVSLNKSLGSLRAGDFGFFFARPETGKTTFLAHCVTAMVAQSGKSCVWINNEEGGNKVLVRCYQSALGLSTGDLFKDIQGNQAKFSELVGDRLRLVNDPTIKYRDIEKLVESVKPALVVIDQLDKLHGFDGERYDLKMKSIYQWARELAKKYKCAVIGVCQAGGTAENKKRLVMTDVDSSYTAKQGEADWVMGIGMTHDDGMEHVRYINICKNKLVGDEDSREDMRHGHFDVLIDPVIGRYRDRINWT